MKPAIPSAGFRALNRLAVWVLAWFTLSIGAAVASPLVNPQNTLLICSGGAMKVLVTNADGSVETASHKLVAADTNLTKGAGSNCLGAYGIYPSGA